MRYLEGVSLAALARGNQRLLAPLKARHANASEAHEEVLADLRERRAKARQIKDPAERAKALDELRGERPTHPTLVAIGCTVVVAVVGWPLLHGYHTVILASAVTAWVVAAFALGYEAPADEAEDEADGEQSEVGAAAPTAAAVRTLAASLTAGRTSVLLTRLAAELGAAHPGWEASTKAVRALLAEARIPVRAGVRTPDGNGPGIHHQDVAAPLPSTEATPGDHVVAGVGAVQSANANANNGGEWTTREGFVLQPDPDNPGRTIVVGRADAA